MPEDVTSEAILSFIASDTVFGRIQREKLNERKIESMLVSVDIACAYF